MLVRQLRKDPRLKKLCDIEASEPPYGIAVLSRFRSRAGPEKLALIVDEAIGTLVNRGRIKGKTLALDSTCIKAYSRRNLDKRTDYSDPESRVGRAVKAKELGYRLHLAVRKTLFLSQLPCPKLTKNGLYSPSGRQACS